MLFKRETLRACLVFSLCWVCASSEENNIRRHDGKLGRNIPLRRWDYWTPWSSCSVDCGTGVTTRSRECRSMLDGQIVTGCLGRDSETRICEITGCIREAHEVTACRKLELSWYGGKRYRWTPYTHPVNPCQMACRPEGGEFYMGLEKNISDGTPCSEDKSKVCVYGQCKSLGCDSIVESGAEMDRCGVCGGTGDTCRHVSKQFTGAAMHGYHKIATIPAGSTNIRISENTASRNYLAARSVDGSFRINTLFRLSRYGDHPGLDTLFKYETQKGPDCPGECISAEGPIDMALEIMILSYVHNDGIAYSYNVPGDTTDTYHTHGIIPNPDPREEDKDNERHIFSSDFKFKKKNRKAHRRGHYNAKQPDGRVDSERDTVDIDAEGVSIHSKTNSVNGSDSNDSDNTDHDVGDISTDNDNVNTTPLATVDVNDNDNSDKSSYIDVSKSETNTLRPSQTTLVSRINEQITEPLSENNQDTIDNVNESGEKQFNDRSSEIINEPEVVTEVTTQAYEYIAQTNPFIEADSVTSGDITSTKPESEESIEDESSENEEGVEEGKQEEGTEIEEEREEDNEVEDVSTDDTSTEQTNQNSTDVIGEIVQRNASTYLNESEETDLTGDSEIAWDDDDEDDDEEGDDGEDDDEQEEVEPAAAGDMYTNDNQIPSLYSWKLTEYSECSQSCGEGKQSPVFECIVTDKDAKVDSTYCSTLTTPRLPVRSCNYGPCPPSWKPRSWSKCSVTCDVGTKTRDYVCTRSDGIHVSDNHCSSVRPRNDDKTCDMGSCTQGWYFTNWPTEESCPAQCGYGEIKRRVHCASDSGNVMTSCPPREKPEVKKTCHNDECRAFWLTGPWSKCNATCGEAYQTRSVACAQKQRQRITVVTDVACQDEEQPPTYMSCDLEACRPDWFMNEWGECSVSCGKGYKSRDVRCLDHQFRPSGGCDEGIKPDAQEPCSTRSCPVADQSRRPRPVPESRPRPPVRRPPTQATDAPPTNCKDTFSQCKMVIRARLCRYSYYAKLCCVSCSRAKNGR